MEKGKRKKPSIELWASQLLKRTMYALKGDLLFTPLSQAPIHPTCHHTAPATEHLWPCASTQNAPLETS